MNNTKFLTVILGLMILLGSALVAQEGAGSRPPHPGMGAMIGHDLENLPLGTTLFHEVKRQTGQALFSDRLIPVFSTGGVEYEMRLPPMAFSGSNLKQGDTLEIQGIFSTLKTPDGKTINWVKPQIVKVGGKEINLEAFREAERKNDEQRFRAQGGLAPGMGPGMHGKPDGDRAPQR